MNKIDICFLLLCVGNIGVIFYLNFLKGKIDELYLWLYTTNQVVTILMEKDKKRKGGK